MKTIVRSIEAEFRRYKALADAAMAQLSEPELCEPGPNGGNSVAVVARHVAGNLASRFTDFLTSDGEKPWRRREEEFAPGTPSRQELRDHWESGWQILFRSLSGLTDAQLEENVVIRGTALPVHEALHRSLAHASYHVGQMVYLAKALRGAEWEYLSIPPGGSEAYNRNPTGERATAHTSRLTDRIDAHVGMTPDPIDRRRFFAEEVQTVCNLRTRSLVDALAAVPRERFLQPGPWLIRGEGDFAGAPRQTPDADPRHVYHNISIAIDPSRQLFNGTPSAVAPCIDALGLRSGDHVLHVGCGLGYYSALMSHCVGSAGRVAAIEIDEALAREARTNLAGFGQVEVRHGNGTEISGELYDAILVNAGMTHPHEAWLDSLKSGGRLVLPLTFTIEHMGPIGKGVVALVSKDDNGDAFDARFVTMTAMYSAVGIRNDALNSQIRDAFMRGAWPTFKRVRRDRHEQSPSCWLHGDTFCFSG